VVSSVSLRSALAPAPRPNRFDQVPSPGAQAFHGCDGGSGPAAATGTVVPPRSADFARERKNASISDEVCVSPTEFETVRFDDFCERLYSAVAWEDRDVDVRRHS